MRSRKLVDHRRVKELYNFSVEETEFARAINDAAQVQFGIHRDRNYRMISFGVWSVLFSRHDYRSVKRDIVEPDVLVSTVWLGFDDLNFEIAVQTPWSDKITIVAAANTEEAALAIHEETKREYANYSPI